MLHHPGWIPPEQARVYTLDGHAIGSTVEAWVHDPTSAQRLRPTSRLRLTRTGTDLYIPFSAIADYTEEAIRLSVTLKQLVAKGWDRRPEATMAGEIERKKCVVDLYKLHQATMWSRIQTATGVEAGVLGGWYALTHSTYSEPALGKLVLLLGAILLLLLALLVARDGEHIGACEDQSEGWIVKPGEGLWNTKFLKGRYIAFTVLLGLAAGNVLFTFDGAVRILKDAIS
jgi:hypothetical protein